VVLFDEIEKPTRRIQYAAANLEDGRLTDAKGRTVDFKNTLLIMTSNIGSRVIEKVAVVSALSSPWKTPSLSTTASVRW